jgi:hypothetical protein
MSKPKRTQRSTTGAKPGTGGAARSGARANGGGATAGTSARPTAGTTAAARAVSTTAARRPASGGAADRSTGSNRVQARANYARNRRRTVSLSWWQTRWFRLGAPIVGVLLVVAIFVYVATRGGSAANASKPVPVDVLHGVTSVSGSTFATVGTGEVANPFTAVTPGVPILRDSSGKPILLYVGAEYCPYCAAERWSMVVALSRFGTFSNLHITSSAPTDGDVPTFTFYKSTYTSPYLTFQPVEFEDRNQVLLQPMTTAQSKLFAKYNPGGSFPFLDFGNQYIAIGASYQTGVLADQDWHSIARVLNEPNSPVAQSIVGTANYMTAAICQINGNKPASVCSAGPIPSIEKTIGKPAGS